MKICFTGNNEASLASLKNALSESPFSIFTVPLGEEILKKIREKTPHVLFLDLTPPKVNGLRFIKRIKALEEDVVLILLVPYELKKKALEGIKLGADNYLIKPVEPEEINMVLGRVMKNIALREEIRKHHAQKLKDLKAVNDLVENSQLKNIYREASTLIKNKKNALVIIGENGTGKEMLIKTIHSLSLEPYSYSPLLIFSCNGKSSKFSSPDYQLVNRNDLVKWLQGGESTNSFDPLHSTLWFKDINKLDDSIQAMLYKHLRHNLRRCKGKKTENGFIFLFTSCQDLAPLVEAKKFHRGLYKFMKDHILMIPPLRKRTQDIIPLSLYFLDLFNEKYNREIEGVDPEAQKFLKSYSWPGNVSELKNVIEHAILTCRKNTLNRDDLELNITGRSITLETLLNQNEFLPLDDMEKLYIRTILRKVKGNKSKAAKILRISRNTLKSKC
jgi:two-component system NtrC family response regulator